jgi:hypothetical protein
MATPDTMMTQAFRSVGKAKAVQACYSYCRVQSPEVRLALPTPDCPIVYSLFGRHDRPESRVLTDKNLLDYLVRVTKESPPLPDSVRATLRAPSTLFLFIGFGFHELVAPAAAEGAGHHGRREPRPVAGAREQQLVFRRGPRQPGILRICRHLHPGR